MRKILHCKMCRSRIIVCLCLVSVGQNSHQIHEHMTAEELRSVFRTDRNSVPEYEVVPVTHTTPDRDGKKNFDVYFKAFGDDVSLHLEPATDVLFGRSTPIYTVSSNSSYFNGLNYDLVSGTGLHERSRIYEDPVKMASIASYEGDDGNIHFNGPYGVNFIIRSLPNRVLRIVNENKTCSSSQLLPRLSGRDDYIKLTSHHVIVKFPMEELTGRRYEHNHEDFPEKNGARTSKEKSSEKLTADATPKIIYPEILVIVDYDSYESHGLNLRETVAYYAAFFNAVDLKYRILEEPKVRLNIAAIIVAMDRAATPYLMKKRINNDLIEAGSLDELSLYLYRETRFPRNSYDTTIAITNSQLCQYSKISQLSFNCHGVRGISKYGTACNWDDKTKRMESVSLIHDKGFNGIATAAHELAHVFGVPHDGSPSLSYVGGPGAKKCKWEDGYLMSSFRHDRHALKWSSCSQQCFRYFFNKPQASCLHNKPLRMGDSLSRILPGKLLTVDEQCFRAIGGKSCWHDENVCTLLWCRVPNTDSDCVASTPAAEGSECGIEKICSMGQCVKIS